MTATTATNPRDKGGRDESAGKDRCSFGVRGPGPSCLRPLRSGEEGIEGSEVVPGELRRLPPGRGEYHQTGLDAPQEGQGCPRCQDDPGHHREDEEPGTRDDPLRCENDIRQGCEGDRGVHLQDLQIIEKAFTAAGYRRSFGRTGYRITLHVFPDGRG